MSKSRGVSGKTHTKQQLDDYANQNNPNNKAYKARQSNVSKFKKEKNRHYVNHGIDFEWPYSGWIE
mgnify:CR=1 FL=1